MFNLSTFKKNFLSSFNARLALDKFDQRSFRNPYICALDTGLQLEKSMCK